MIRGVAGLDGARELTLHPVAYIPQTKTTGVSKENRQAGRYVGRGLAGSVPGCGQMRQPPGHEAPYTHPTTFIQLYSDLNSSWVVEHFKSTYGGAGFARAIGRTAQQAGDRTALRIVQQRIVER